MQIHLAKTLPDCAAMKQTDNRHCQMKLCRGVVAW